MPDMSIDDMPIVDMSWSIACVAAPCMGASPGQKTRPPGPGMNPAGIRARAQNASNSNVANSASGNEFEGVGYEALFSGDADRGMIASFTASPFIICRMSMTKMVSSKPTPDRSLYRSTQSRGGEPLSEVFDALAARIPSSSFWRDDSRGVTGAHLRVDPAQGTGSWEFLRIRSDLFMAGTDAIYDEARHEEVLGEGNFEFYAKLSGKVRIDVPRGGSFEVTGPTLVFVRQARGTTMRETLHAHTREICASVHCRPEYLLSLLDAKRQRALQAMVATGQDNPLVLRQFPLSPALAVCVRHLLSCPFEGALRLLYHEAKVLELICHALDACSDEPHKFEELPCTTDVRLDRARSLLTAPSERIPSVRELARVVGLSESKLKRDFTAAFGKSIFEYALERRMGAAMDMLRSGSVPIGDIAAAVGYRHHTSFTAAFRRFYGFTPRSSGR